MPRHRLNLLILAVVIAGGMGLVWYSTRPKPVKVLVKQVERGIVEQTIANTRAGTVKACRRAKLSPSLGGQIAILAVKEGDRVKAGALLLELWNKDLKAQVALNESEANAAKSHAEATCLRAEVARREADRLVRLSKTGAISIESVDKAVTSAESSQADCESARASTNVSRARVGVARAQLERTRLVAPFDGVVAEINGELNEYVTPSPPGIPTPPAVDLIDNTCFYVAAPIDEVDAPRIEVGKPARISLDAFGDQRFPGRVRRIAPYVLDIEKQARTVEVEVEFTRPEDIRRLLAGYSADVEVILDARRDTLRIPTEAVLEDNRVLVFLPDEELLEERGIKTGMSNWDYTEVRSGLKPDDLVVISLDRKGVEDGAYARLDPEAPR
ncbi:MAG TPA: efflux RND transporter periplasmic adaptor subunit [Sedimenticola sp.]|nr:efflux RND transporter periplasmic adaptor subunit [Sedimenticola sp.]